jgi:hypothetical protein
MINRRNFLKALGIVSLSASSVGQALESAFGSAPKLQPATWYALWEAWDKNGNAHPMIGLGNDIPGPHVGWDKLWDEAKLDPIQRVLVFGTDKQGNICKVLRRTTCPEGPVTSFKPAYANDGNMISYLNKVAASK